MDLLEAFPTEQACIQYLINIRHNGKMDCPYCDHLKVYSFKDGKLINVQNIIINAEAFVFEPTAGVAKLQIKKNYYQKLVAV